MTFSSPAAVREEDVEVERRPPVFGVRDEGEVVGVVGRDDDLPVLHRMLLDVRRWEPRKLTGPKRERAGRRADVDRELLADVGELRVVLAQQLLLVGWEVEAVAAEVTERVAEQPGALSLELLTFRGVRLDDPRYGSVEVEASPQLVDLRIAELGRGTHRRVRVRDGHEIGKLLCVVHLDHGVVESSEGRRVGQLVGRCTGERADLGELLFGSGEVIVAQSLLSVRGETVRHRIERGRRRGRWSRSHDDGRRSRKQRHGRGQVALARGQGGQRGECGDAASGEHRGRIARATATPTALVEPSSGADALSE